MLPTLQPALIIYISSLTFSFNFSLLLEWSSHPTCALKDNPSRIFNFRPNGLISVLLKNFEFFLNRRFGNILNLVILFDIVNMSFVISAQQVISFTFSLTLVLVIFVIETLLYTKIYFLKPHVQYLTFVCNLFDFLSMMTSGYRLFFCLLMWAKVRGLLSYTGFGRSYRGPN